MRPVLPTALRRLWRDRETLQLGRPPGPAAVVAGVDPATRAALTLLDGTRTAAQVVGEARLLGCPSERTTALLDLLDGAGLLGDAAARPAFDRLGRAERDRLAGDVAGLAVLRGREAAPALARRAGGRVVVVGAGRVGAAVAGLLAASGVGAVDVDDPGQVRAEDTGVGAHVLADVGRRRDEAARERLRAVAPSAATGSAPPALVVLAPVEGPPDRVPAEPHLLAEVRDGVGVVGPLVVPGRTACLHCLELRRTDRDPDWPALAVQLTAGPEVAPGSGVLAAAVAAQAAAQALGLLDGWPVPAAVGGTLELVPPDWRWRRRSWAPHADCGCLRAAG